MQNTLIVEWKEFAGESDNRCQYSVCLPPQVFYGLGCHIFMLFSGGSETFHALVTAYSLAVPTLEPEGLSQPTPSRVLSRRRHPDECLAKLMEKISIGWWSYRYDNLPDLLDSHHDDANLSKTIRQRVYETLNAFRKAGHQQRKKCLLIDCPWVTSFYQKCTLLSSLA